MTPWSDELGQRGIAPQQIVLGGFSQGACLALEYAARRGQKLGGVLAFSGALLTLEHGGDLAGTPIFMGVAPDDAHIPLERFEESAAALRSMGAQVNAQVYPGLGHSVNKAELDAARDLMQRAARAELMAVTSAPPSPPAAARPAPQSPVRRSAR